MKTCKWCADGAPEWSYHAKVWIHRRERLDRVCENPPNNYGYTTQVPEETVSSKGHVDWLKRRTLTQQIHAGAVPPKNPNRKRSSSYD